ncbi:M20/M25/M40 family metallo-hydrolase [Oxalobacteraceae bacterium]|nr:M20/M25/M40 family metallo-hydrolase [Oxalobacteraceae bacterium]
MNKSTTSRLTPGWGLCVLFLVCLIATLGLLHARGPAPLASDAPPAVFSAERAMVHLRQIAREPHPIGSAANAEVRDYLLTQLRALGLEPQVHSAVGVTKTALGGNAGTVHNVLVRVPGRTPGKAVMLSAHYDSVPTGPGAADDGASVAAILETLRALRSGAALEHDVIVLLSDGEEATLLGAEAFVASHPWARDVGLALNFEYRGNSGPMMMFETSIGNGKLIPGFAQAASHPIGSSLLYEVYKLLPNDTDMSPFKRAGIPGMNFAAIESPFSYHAEIDKPEALNQRSLQHEGELMLSLVRHFSARDLSDLAAPDEVYFDVPGMLLHYPAAWALPLALGAAVLLIGLLCYGKRQGQMRIARVLWAVPAYLLMLVLLAGAALLLWRGITLLHPLYTQFIGPYNSHWYLLAFMALVTGGFVSVQAGLSRWLGALELAGGAMLCWLAILLATALRMPGVSFLFMWPLLLTIAVLAWLMSPRAKALSGRGRSAWLLAAAAPLILLFAPLLMSLYVGLGPKTLMVPAAVLVLLLGLLSPLLETLTRRWLLPLLPLTAGMLALVAGSVTADFSVVQPRPSELSYVFDGKAGAAHWVSANPELDQWNGNYFAGVTERLPMPQLFGERPGVWWSASAPASVVNAPEITVLQDTVSGQERRLELAVRSLRTAARLTVTVEGAPVLASTLQGRALADISRKGWTVNGYALAGSPLLITLRLPAGQPAVIRATDRSYGLGALGVAARPVGLMSYPFGASDTVQAVSVLDLAKSNLTLGKSDERSSQH